MLLRAFILLCLLACAGVNAAEPVPNRIVSINLCTDQLLLALVPPERIASVTWLSRSEGDPALLPLVQHLPANRGSAEEVLALKPDLVLAGRFTTSTTRALLRRVGVPLLEVDAVQDWEGIRRITREVAAAVGAMERGEQLLRGMDATLEQVAAVRGGRRVRAVGWSGSALDVPGTDTLFHTILDTAGGENLAAAPGVRRGFDLEQVLRAQPQVLLRGTAYGSGRAVRSSVADHPVLRHLPALQVIEYPEAVYGCGVPRAADLALQLATALARVAATP